MINQDYQIQGVSLHKVANEFGTPTYVYDAQKIKSQFDLLKTAFSGVDLRVKFASKALTNISILRLLRSYGSELDCVSIQEVQLGLMAGYEAKEILYTPNGVEFSELESAVELGVKINLDNLSTLKLFGEKFGGRVPIGVRLNPHVMAGGNKKISTGHAGSKFGISIYQLSEVQQIIEEYGIALKGLHIHTGSDILEADVFLNVANILFETARKFEGLEFLDLGSGFKVAYKEGDVTTDILDVGKKLSLAFKKFCAEYGRDLELWFEPGKFLVSEAGYLLAKTNVVKKTPANVFVGINSGLNHLIRPMMYDAHHDIINISNPIGDSKVYTIVGYICETDTFGIDRKMNEVNVGDLIIIKNAGAYCFSMASNYNSRFRPAEVLIHEGKAHLIRERETMEDLTRKQVLIDL